MKKTIASSLLALTLLVGCGPRDTSYDEFAQCLADSGTLYYGSFTCSNCLEQGKMFGDSKELLPYIECHPNGKNSQTEVCEEAGITATPTWVFSNGTTIKGRQSMETLAEESGCLLPTGSALFESSED